MITLEHKKLIALKFLDDFNGDFGSCYFENFDPTSPEYFYEILGKLTSEQKEKIKYIMSWRDRDVNPSIWDNHSNPHPIDTALWIESHKEEIITALIEVLEGME